MGLLKWISKGMERVACVECGLLVPKHSRIAGRCPDEGVVYLAHERHRAVLCAPCRKQLRRDPQKDFCSECEEAWTGWSFDDVVNEIRREHGLREINWQKFYRRWDRTHGSRPRS